MHIINIDTQCPELTALIAALEEARKAHAAAFHPGDDFFNTNERRHADASSWVALIEAALDNSGELARLKDARHEALILCESRLLFADAKLRAVAAAELELEQAIANAVAAVERIDKSTPDRWLKDVLRSNIVHAKRGICHHTCPFLDKKPEPLNDTICAETKPAAEAAFAVLATTAATLPVRHCTRDFVGHSFVNLYPLTPVTSAARLNIMHAMFDEARAVWNVELSADLAAQLPAVAALVETVERSDRARRQAFEHWEKLQRSEKGRVNERQYAARMVRALDTPGVSVKDEREAQHGRRLDYQSARLAVYGSVIAAEGLRMEVLKALKAAIAETQALDGTNELARRVAIINCLHADRILRFTGNQLKELFAAWVEDLSDGKGNEALEREYAEIARHVKRRS